MNNPTRLALTFALLLVLTACRSITSDEVLLRVPGPGHKFSREPIVVSQLASKFPLVRDMARLSAVVYPDTTHKAPERFTARPELRAQAEDALASDPNAPRKQKQKPAGKLEYELYVDSSASPKVAVIAFRGTDSPIDHYTNFRWFTWWIPGIKDQYEQAELVVPVLVARIKSEIGPDTKIIATGHSLGGGLAQTAGYVACHDIDAVYAFDPSPVTKHRASPANCPDERPVYRIYENNEILALSRLPLRLAIGLSDNDPRITEAKLQLLPGRFTGHSMQALATEIDRKVQ